MAIDLISRTRDVVANVENPVFVEELEALLPDTVPVKRFVQVAKTAIRVNSDLVTCDENSLFGSIVRCAQDGLIPDGHEAALVPYKGKVSYLPMIGGIRKRLAEYGWTLRTGVVRDGDDFDWSDEPPTLSHRRRVSSAGATLTHAWAVAVHRDGRREQLVMDAEEVGQRRKKAQTDQVWREWPVPMWEKTVGKALAKRLPLSEAERYALERLTADDFTTDTTAAELLYGPHSAAPDQPVSPTDETQTAPTDGSHQQAETAAPLPDAAVSVPGDDTIIDGEFEPIDDEPADPLGEISRDEYTAALGQKVTRGLWKDKTLGDIAEAGTDGVDWLLAQLKRAEHGTPQWRVLAVVIHERLPETWAAYLASVKS